MSDFRHARHPSGRRARFGSSFQAIAPNHHRPPEGGDHRVSQAELADVPSARGCGRQRRRGIGPARGVPLRSRPGRAGPAGRARGPRRSAGRVPGLRLLPGAARRPDHAGVGGVAARVRGRDLRLRERQRLPHRSRARGGPDRRGATGGGLDRPVPSRLPARSRDRPADLPCAGAAGGSELPAHGPRLPRSRRRRLRSRADRWPGGRADR